MSQPSFGESHQPDPAAALPSWPPSPPPSGQPDGPARRRRGAVIASIVLTIVLLLCGTGGVAAVLLLREAENAEGAAEPVAAVDTFLRAVYTERDATKAAALVCSEARDTADISRKVAEVKRSATTYTKPRYQWTPPKIDEQGDERARVSATLTMITGDEKAAEQRLTFTVVRKTGWWVCEVAG